MDYYKVDWFSNHLVPYPIRSCRISLSVSLEAILFFVAWVILGLEDPDLWFEHHPSLDGWVRR